MSHVRCEECVELGGKLAGLTARNQELEAEAASLKAQLHEAMKLVELQRADLARYRAAYERVQPNTPERVPANQLQLAFERVLLALKDSPAANDVAAAAREAASRTQPEKKKRSRHGRRNLELTGLPVERIEMDPDEVVAAGGKGFEQIGEEVSERLAYRQGGYVRLRIVRRKWARVAEKVAGQSAVVVAAAPDNVWPRVMADPSAVTQVILSKYDDSLPLNRQERISARQGFRVPRSTQCCWLGAAYQLVRRVAEAMYRDALAHAFCIATDATGAPVRAPGKCEPWHVFVMLADNSHVLFRYVERQTSEAVSGLLSSFRGHLLLDAAPVYDALFKDGERIEVGCWFHCRQGFWRALQTEGEPALEALSLISKLFEVERTTSALPLHERTAQRAAGAKPVLALFDEWVGRHRDKVDPRGPLDKAIGYYDNQRDALHRFLADGRLRLDNSVSEQQLRNLALGRHNWVYFANETGLRWYTTFRSLIASCALHGLNAHQYIEQLLRLAPHWPTPRVLELSPKYWSATLAKLDARHRAILQRPWERSWPSTPPLAAQAAA